MVPKCSRKALISLLCAALVIFEGLSNQLGAAQTTPYGPAPTAPQQLPAYGIFGPRALNASCATSNYNLCPSGSVAGVQAFGASAISIQVSGVYNATLQIESALDCTNFNALSLTPQAGGSATSTISGGTTGIWSGSVLAQGCVQVRITSFTSGTANVTISATSSGGVVASSSSGGAVTTTPTTFVPTSVPTLFATNNATCNPCSAAFQFIPLSAGKTTYMLGLTVNSSVTQSITLEYGTGTTCATGTVTLGPFSVTAGSALQLGFTVIPSGQALCILPGASGVLGAISMAYQQ